MGRRASGRLLVWQLADQLRTEVFKVTARDAFDADHKLRTQTDDAVDAICRNIAEALGTDRDRDFARFVRLARSSVNDVQDALRRAQMKKMAADADVRHVRELLSRLYPALSSLLTESSRTSNQGRRPSSGSAA